MRVLPLLGLAAALLRPVLAWSPEDHEIFRIRDEVEEHEGKDVSFYDFIGLPKGTGSHFTSLEDINKAYKKTSKLLHPDKARLPKRDASLPPLSPAAAQRQLTAARKLANDRFTRLGIVAEVLRSPARERYDHFLQNGFPMWRGTGYYYARMRPGLVSVLVCLWLLVGGAGHYAVQNMKATQQKKFIQSFIDEAREKAWGPNGVPGVPSVGPNGEVATAKENGKGKPKDGGKRKVITQTGRVFFVYPNGDVSLVEEYEGGKDLEFPTANMMAEIQRPSFKRTWAVTLPQFLWNKSLGRVTGKTFGNENVDDTDDSSSSEDEATSSNGNGKQRKNKGPGKAKLLNRSGMADGMPRKRVRRNRRPLQKDEDDM